MVTIFIWMFFFFGLSIVSPIWLEYEYWIHNCNYPTKNIYNVHMHFSAENCRTRTSIHPNMILKYRSCASSAVFFGFSRVEVESHDWVHWLLCTTVTRFRSECNYLLPFGSQNNFPDKCTKITFSLSQTRKPDDFNFCWTKILQPDSGYRCRNNFGRFPRTSKSDRVFLLCAMLAHQR